MRFVVAEVEGWEEYMAWASRMSIHVAGGSIISQFRLFGGLSFSQLSMSSLRRRQLQSHLLLLLAKPRRARWGLLQPGVGIADYSSGCGGKGSPVEKERVRGWGL